jgi:hypothetical protein
MEAAGNIAGNEATTRGEVSVRLSASRFVVVLQPYAKPTAKASALIHVAGPRTCEGAVRALDGLLAVVFGDENVA